MLFKNILVPFDLSKSSNHAFKVALDVAKKYDSKVTVLTAVEGDSWHHKFYDSRADNELIKKQKKAASKSIEHLEKAAKNANIPLKTQIVKSTSTVNTIITFAKSRKFDLIVIGSHGRTGFDKLILGSVANGVVQKSRIPVLVVK